MCQTELQIGKETRYSGAVGGDIPATEPCHSTGTKVAHSSDGQFSAIISFLWVVLYPHSGFAFCQVFVGVAVLLLICSVAH